MAPIFVCLFVLHDICKSLHINIKHSVACMRQILKHTNPDRVPTQTCVHFCKAVVNLERNTSDVLQ